MMRFLKLQGFSTELVHQNQRIRVQADLCPSQTAEVSS